MFFVATAPSKGPNQPVPQGISATRSPCSTSTRRLSRSVRQRRRDHRTPARQRPDHHHVLLVHPHSRILRLSGIGRVVRPDDAEFGGTQRHISRDHTSGIRAVVVIDVERIADACGYAVPYYELVDERPVLDRRTPAADRREDRRPRRAQPAQH